MDEKQLLLSRLDDLTRRAARQGWTATHFLTLAQVRQASAFACPDGVTMQAEGGFAGAERARLVFCSRDWGNYDGEEILAALALRFRAEDGLTHRDILGSVMALGVERDAVGDIVAREDGAFMVCLPDLAGYITGELSRIGRAGVRVERTALHTLPPRQEELRMVSASVASLRLDAMVSAAFRLPRDEAAGIIRSGLVTLEYEPCLQPSKPVGEGELISARGYGRARLVAVGGLSRKGRQFVEIGLF